MEVLNDSQALMWAAGFVISLALLFFLSGKGK